MWLPRSAGLAATLTLSLAANAAAQSSPHVAVGGAGVWLDDQAPRVGLGALEEAESGWAWSIDGNVFVAPRIAVGVEWLRPPVARTDTRGHFGQVSVEERQVTISGTVRARVGRRRDLSLDVVAGIGQLRSSTRRQSSDIYSPGSPVIYDTTEHNQFLVLSTGADLLLTPARHLALGQLVRFYWLRAPERVPEFPGELTRLLDGPTTRVVVGGVVRAVW